MDPIHDISDALAARDREIKALRAELEVTNRGVLALHSELDAQAKALRDTTQQLIEREQAARALSEQSNRTKDDFIAMLSHELRNPLNAMMMGIGVLRRLEVSERAAKIVGMIENNALTQARLISDLLDVSRIHSGKLTLKRESVDLRNLITTSIAEVMPAIDAKSLTVQSELQAENTVQIVDRARFQQIFWNILNNAIKFSEPGGQIMVRLRVGTRIQLVVQDFGKGIEASFLASIFDKFSQGTTPGDRVHGGLGLGMPIVKQLTELHQGSVTVASDGLNRGTTVEVDLPAMSGSSIDAANGQAPPGATGSGEDLTGLKVLVVEDSIPTRTMLELVLRERGAVVSQAGDYASALSTLETDHPHIMLGDIGLPGIDGYELMKEIRRREAEAGRTRMWAVACTAFGRPEDRAAAQRAGYDAFVVKPTKPHVLISEIVRRKTADVNGR